MAEGIILKGYGGFYYVKTDRGETVECTARGRFRKEKVNFLPGDKVSLSIINENQGVVEELHPRSSQLLRPPVSNVDQALLVTSLAAPVPDLFLLDRLLVFLEQTPVTPIICFNKVDIAEPQLVAELEKTYGDCGYNYVITSAKNEQGLAELSRYLQGRISVFAGPSGVGKSSLLNALKPGLRLQTGQVSSKSNRGRHTTRHTELLELEGGLVADTPGFSRLELPVVVREELSFLFPEMDRYRHRCRFSTCLHNQEPDCAVREAAEKGDLCATRYNNYLKFLEEVIAKERSY